MPGPVRTTTAPAVKAAAVAALRQALPAQQVSYGFPGDGQLESELVFFGSIDGTEDWAELGRGARDERYTINLILNVQHSGQTQQEVTERAFALLAAADLALTNSSLVPPPGWALLQFTRLVERPGDAAREAEITAGLRVYARI
jgi:hypothetical protein